MQQRSEYPFSVEISRQHLPLCSCLGFGEILEDWTHKKSVDDLARSMSLNVSKVWLVTEGGEVLVNSDQIKPGDEVKIHMGTVIPFDGDRYRRRGNGQSGISYRRIHAGCKTRSKLCHMQELLLRKASLPSV